jgi:hypothetical protein
MSAYAMPGMFPPLPTPPNQAIGESCCSSPEEEKIDYNYHYNSSSLAFGSEVKLAIREVKVDSAHLILTTLGSGGRKRRPGSRKPAIRPEELCGTRMHCRAKLLPTKSTTG